MDTELVTTNQRSKTMKTTSGAEFSMSINNDTIGCDLVSSLGINPDEVEAGTLTAERWGGVVMVKMTVARLITHDAFQPYLDRLTQQDKQQLTYSTKPGEEDPEL